jgi:hypothetical protein
VLGAMLLVLLLPLVIVGLICQVLLGLNEFIYID